MESAEKEAENFKDLLKKGTENFKDLTRHEDPNHSRAVDKAAGKVSVGLQKKEKCFSQTFI